MTQSPQQGNNRTGILASGRLGEEIVEATREFRPSSPGTAQAIAEVRVAYAHEGASLGEAPSDTLLFDKLGERLAFEHAGARLYEALLSKHQAYGSFDGGPGADEILHILTEEYEHGDLLERAIKDLGGDPTALTPSANLAVNISAGLPQVLADPRTNLLQSLEAIVVAELADNECWTTLEQLARQAGHDELAGECREAIAHEREHLRTVRRWIAAGHGRTMAEADGGAMMEESSDDDFTFTENSRVDREGYVVSEEEAAEGGEASKQRPAGTPRKGRSPRRDR
jgi:hypothetical protein